MQKVLIVICAALIIVSCKEKKDKKGSNFTVSGTITNNTSKVVYLEEVPASTMQPVIADSMVIGKDGKFSLDATAAESMIFNLRLDKNQYPVASVINDVPKLTLDIKLAPGQNEFAESYEVKGSPASQQMKDYMVTFNNELKNMYTTLVNEDSLKKNGGADSLLQPLAAEKKNIADKLRSFATTSFSKVVDPSLLLFELGYYQSNANNPQFGLQPLDITEVVKVINDASARFPGHKVLASISKSMNDELNKNVTVSLVGKPAPDFTLPDVDGKEVALSSFKGKYVLVDFWASWCQPCRYENPNVVGAYNKFRDKNFTVLGVSLDKPGEKDKWLAAIKKDGLTWTHVSDLKFWESPIVSLYHFSGIPYNVLIDPSGKVIAEELRGEALHTKLAEVLK